ncbi:MAG: hypothetical protein Q9227_002049 [Pyrenula ochraceoflavens]
MNGNSTVWFSQANLPSSTKCATAVFVYDHEISLILTSGLIDRRKRPKGDYPDCLGKFPKRNLLAQFSGIEDTFTDKDGSPPIWHLHIQMHGIGDKYQCDSLKSFSYERVLQGEKTGRAPFANYSESERLDFLQLVYENTTESDKAFRDIAITMTHLAAEKYGIFKDEKWQSCIKANPEISFDLLTKPLKTLETGQWADVSVRCGGYTWKLHRLVLCQKSDYFGKMLDGHFREAQEQLVTLEDEIPSIAARALIFLYTADYPTDITGDMPGQFNGFTDDYVDLGSDWIDSLKEAARRKFHDVLLAKNEADNLEIDQQTEAEIIAKHQEWLINVLPVCKVVFETTPPTDRFLRDPMLCMLHVLIAGNALAVPEMLDFLDEHGYIAREILTSRVCENYHTCSECDEISPVLERFCDCGKWHDCKTTVVCPKRIRPLCYNCDARDTLVGCKESED